MRRLSVLALVLLVSSLLFPTAPATAATFRSHVARVPETPTSAQGVRVWMQSDTAFGEAAGLEYNPVGTNTYVKVLGSFDNSGPAGANWRADIPAQPGGTQVRYQLFTRNQSGQDYGFSGFNWDYTVDDGDIRWNGLRHDTFDSYYRAPSGAVPTGTSVTLRFRTEPLDVDGVSVRVYRYDPATDATSGPFDYPMTYLEDRVENGTNYAIWSYTVATPATPAILYYKFRITDRLDVDWYSDAYADDHDNLNQGGPGATSDDEPFPSFQLTVYDPAFATPEWLQNANVYQIFPDRFRNGDPSNDPCRPGATSGCPTFYGNISATAHAAWNEAPEDGRATGVFNRDFFGGDLKGIEDKLDYLQGLGIDTLYLTPIFKARSNHRYDADDYLEVDPALGGDAAFVSLVQAMETRGMRIILDGVFNHSSSDSRYFDRYGRYPGDGACESTGSVYRDWYLFNSNATPCGSADYPGWFGFDSLAVFDDGSPALRDFIYRTGAENVVAHWYERGAGGWRFDVADEISHNWWRDFRPYAKGYAPDGPLVGEVWYDATRFLLGDQLDSVMNYRFRKNVLGFARATAHWNDNDNNGSNNIVALSPSQFDRALRSVREDYPPEATAAMLNLLDSHDTNRALYVLTLLGDNGLAQAKQRLKLAALFQFTYLGAPMVYYGDEAGIDAPSKANGPNGPEDDPYNRAPYPWADETGNPNLYGPADANLIGFYAELAHLRKQHPALRIGSFETLLTGDTTPSNGDNGSYAFARVGGGERAVVALNQSDANNTAVVPVGAHFADGTRLYDALGGAEFTVAGGSVSVPLAGRGGVILFADPAAPDTAAPTASASVSPAANAAGWNNGAVTVQLGGSDGGSGVKELRYWIDDGAVAVASSDSVDVPLAAEGTTTVSVRAIDQAFNGSQVARLEVRIDTAAPSIALASRTPANAAGWNNTDVDITWTCADGLSGPQAASLSRTLSAEGAELSASGVCADRAGNQASDTQSGIKIDKTAPEVVVTGVSDGATYTVGAVPAAGCETTDTLAGVAVPAAASVSGGNSDGTGTFTATCDGAADNAGNLGAPARATYTVQAASYTFSGFFEPVNNWPTLNAVKAGRAIPVRFSLGGDYGLDIFAEGYPKSFRIPCSPFAPVDPIEQTVDAPTSELFYDASTGRYTYVWKTDSDWSGTCRALVVKLDDGTVRRATFKFRR